MKKIFFVLMMAICGGTALGQLRVSNGFGQDLQVTIKNSNGSESRDIPNNGMATFSVRSQAVTLKCKITATGQTFSVYKGVPRSGLVTVEVSDYKITAANPKAVASAPTVSPEKSGTALPFIYKGGISFKIFSETGRGLEFFKDSTGNNDDIKEVYLNVPTNNDMVLGIGIKNGEDQAIWPYAEIRKRVNATDTAVIVSDKDIKQMSTGEVKKLKIRLVAKDYKIFFEPGSGEPVSLGFNSVSRPIEVPIGQFYIKMSFTDPSGMFHSTVFVPKHVTGDDKHLDITENDLKNAVKLDW